jgi:hypothetical protein
MRDGAHAKAVVIAAKGTGGRPGDGTYSAVQYHVELRAHFDDGSSTEVSRRVGGALRGTDLSSSEGDIVPVRYDPADRSKLEIDVAALKAAQQTNPDQAKQFAISRAEARLAGEARSRPALPAALETTSKPSSTERGGSTRLSGSSCLGSCKRLTLPDGSRPRATTSSRCAKHSKTCETKSGARRLNNSVSDPRPADGVHRGFDAAKLTRASRPTGW